MKNILSYLIIFTLPIFCFAQKNFEITGTITGLKQSNKVFLVYDADGKKVVDSTIVNDGNFKLSGRVNYPVYASIVLGKNPYLVKGIKLDYFKFLLENSPMVMTANDSLKNIVISGSPMNKLHEELRQVLKGNDEQMKMLGVRYAQLKEKEQKDSLDYFIEIEKKINKEAAVLNLSFARKYPNSYISIFSVMRAASISELSKESKLVYDMLAPEIKNSPLGKNTVIILASHDLVKVGKTAPNFEQKSPEGRVIRLSDFKNHYILLDFWASWCAPCRKENPNLVAAYEKFKSKGFQVLGVSLDDESKKTAWVKAIADDRLTWPQVSDLKGWENSVALMYGVRLIPTNFLIDPAGKVIAKDLTGADLNRKLEALFSTK